MFIVPLSLFLIATYLRPRTQAELSYMMTAIECLGGLWCLLFAPFQIQLSLVGFLLLRNTGSLQSLIEKRQAQYKGYLDLSNASSPTIDIKAKSVEGHLLNPASSSPSEPDAQKRQNLTPTSIAREAFLESTSPTPKFTRSNNHFEPSSVLNINTKSTAIVSTRAQYRTQNSQKAIAVLAQQPHPQTTAQKQIETQPPKGSTVIQTQLVEMQYRGITYLKSIYTPALKHR